MNDLPTTASGTLRMLPETKSEIASFVEAVKTEVLSGFIDPLQFEVRMKALEMAIEQIRADKEIKAAVLSEAEKYNAKTFDAFGAKLSIREVGVRYDFTKCGSTDWKFYDYAVKCQTANRKKAEEFLKALPETGMADPETGEVIYPPTKTSTTTVVIELK